MTLALLLLLGAHIQLDDPPRRYDDMKGTPCGKGGGADGRTSNYTRFDPGEEITVKWQETIGHEGSFRIAFDDDGGDQDDFDAHVLKTMDDPGDDKDQWQATVTLPDVECGNCTLQLEQIMTTGTPTDDNTYHQCADLVIGDVESAPPGGCASTSAPPCALAALLLFARAWRSTRKRAS